MLAPTSERIRGVFLLGDIAALVYGTVVPRPSGCRMTWWLPLMRATLKPAL
jgi:hypothetical protein